MAGFIKESIPESTPIVKNDFRHALCVGETGCGKTTSFMLPNIDERIKNSYGMLIVDVKGTLHSDVKVIANKYGRLQDVIEIGVPWGEKINLFKNISRSLFLNTLSNIYGDTKDVWISSALNIAGHLYDILAISKNLEELVKDITNLGFDYSFDTKSLNEILSSFKSLKLFIDECKLLTYSFEIKQIVKLAKYNISEDNFYLIRQFSQEFKQISEKVADFYNEIDQENPASGNGGTFFTLHSLINTFSQNGLDGKVELKELLERGKIVVMHVADYDENLHLSIMNILYKRLLIRNNSKPITLFIDEFQRSVTKNSIPFIDLFREMNVELIVAMQNIHQLRNKLGDTQCDEFLGNILHNYEFANHIENSLDTFEYIHNKKKASSKPIFIKNKDKILAQLKWQKLINNPLLIGWIYLRSAGHKKVLIRNIKTNQVKYHYLLEKKDAVLETELMHMKINTRNAVA